jgi:transposase
VWWSTGDLREGRSVRVRHWYLGEGNVWLRQVLIEIAHVASKTKDTYLAAQYRRIAARRGKKRALVALGHTILVMIYQILTRRESCHELGVAYFDQLERQRVEQRVICEKLVQWRLTRK